MIYNLIGSIVAWIAGFIAVVGLMGVIDAPTWLSLASGWAYGWFATQALLGAVFNEQ